MEKGKSNQGGVAIYTFGVPFLNTYPYSAHGPCISPFGRKVREDRHRERESFDLPWLGVDLISIFFTCRFSTPFWRGNAKLVAKKGHTRHLLFAICCY